MATERRLIDAEPYDEFLTQYAQDLFEADAPMIAGAIERCQRALKTQPTVDAVEVVHGRWIPLEYDGFADGNPVWDLWECSECREEHSGDEDTLTPYCPNCGAKMDGDGNG